MTYFEVLIELQKKYNEIEEAYFTAIEDKTINVNHLASSLDKAKIAKDKFSRFLMENQIDANKKALSEHIPMIIRS